MWWCLGRAAPRYPPSGCNPLLSCPAHSLSTTWSFYLHGFNYYLTIQDNFPPNHLWTKGSVLGFSAGAIEFCLSFLQFLNFSSSRTLVHETGKWNRRCTPPAGVNCSWTLRLAENKLKSMITLKIEDCFLYMIAYLENDHPSSLIPSSQQLSILVELHTGYNVGCKQIS